MNQFKAEFMCGSYFKSLCKYSVQEYTDARNHQFCFKIHQDGDPSKIFCKTEYLDHFLQNFRIEYPFDLLTHNSDIHISPDDYRKGNHFQPNLRYWYAQNLCGSHPMMQVLPIGLANPKWEHGNQETFSSVMSRDIEKNNILDVNFDIYTNPNVRKACLDETELAMRDRAPFKEHLEILSSSFFCISPEGNGVDCHRHWEALYLKTVPIVTRSILTESLQDKGIPLLILDNWRQFKEMELSQSLYYNMTKDFEWNSLNNLFINLSKNP